MQGRLSQLAPMGPPKSAMVTGLLGARLGANIASHQATPDLAQPKSLQVNGTPCGAWPHLATVRACMACKRSGVRIPFAPPLAPPAKTCSFLIAWTRFGGRRRAAAGGRIPDRDPLSVDPSADP